MLQEVLYHCFELSVCTLSDLKLRIDWKYFIFCLCLLFLHSSLIYWSWSTPLQVIFVCFPKSFWICNHKWFSETLFFKNFLIACYSKSGRLVRSELLSSMSQSAALHPVPTLLFWFPKYCQTSGQLLPNFSSFPFTRPLLILSHTVLSLSLPSLPTPGFSGLEGPSLSPGQCGCSSFLKILPSSYHWKMRGAFLFILFPWMFHPLLQSSLCLALLCCPPHPIHVRGWKMCSLVAYTLLSPFCFFCGS